MSGIRYVPGEDAAWTVLVAGGLIAAIDLTDRADVIDELWAGVAAQAGPGVVLDALTRGGITSAPSFVLVDSLSGALLIRGAAIVLTSDGEEISGGGATTWVERAVDPTGLVLRFGRASAHGPLPLVSGVVRASEVIVGAFAPPPDPLSAESERVPLPVVREPVHHVRPEPPATEAVPTEHDFAGEETIIPTITVAEVPSVAAAEPLTESPEDGGDYDFLFGRTVMRTVEDAAVRVAEDDAGVEAAPSDLTVRSSDLAALRAKRRADRAAATAGSQSSGFVLDGPTGIESLDQPVVIGRAPVANRVAGDRVPKLITIANDDVSRTHVQVEVQGEAIVVTDLHSSNGTMIVLPGKPPQRIRPGEPTTVIAATVIDLGGGVAFTVKSRV